MHFILNLCNFLNNLSFEDFNGIFSERFVYGFYEFVFMCGNLICPRRIFHRNRKCFAAVKFRKGMFQGICVNEPRREFAIFFANERSFGLAREAELFNGFWKNFLDGRKQEKMLNGKWKMENVHGKC